MAKDAEDSVSKNSRHHIDNILNWGITVAAVVGIAGIVVYRYNFDGGFSGEQADWGAFGDFVGGLVNPILGFVTVIALLFTIRLQISQLKLSGEELALSRKELEETKEELRRTADTQQAQLESIQREERKEDLYRIVVQIYEEILADTSIKIEGLTGLYPASFVGPKKDDKAIKMFLEEIQRPREKRGNGWSQAEEKLLELSGKLKELHYFMSEFDKLSGDVMIMEYYRSRLYKYADDLRSMGCMSDEDRNRFIDPIHA